MSTAVVIAALAFVATPVAVLLMLRKEEPMRRRGLMEVKCHICNKRLFVSERDPHPGLWAHFDTEEHKRNEREKDA